MKIITVFPTTLVSFFLAAQLNAQTAFLTRDSLSINKINAMVTVHGDLWFDPSDTTAHCFYPAGTHNSISSAGGLWMSGYDASSSLHISANMYRMPGNDFWPGPLDASGSLTYDSSQKWSRIWNVTKSQIDAFRALTSPNATNTPAVIWEWPAKGNTHAKGAGGAALAIGNNMAPFVDVNGDGTYSPELGDYPKIKGDQALWWVYSDNGPVHNQTGGTPLKVEVHAMAYGYNRGGATDRMLFYAYDIINQSSVSYDSFRVGMYADVDLGGYSDDFIGCDTTRALGFYYNGDITDAQYGTTPPVAGITMEDLSSGGTHAFMSSFGYVLNDGSAAGKPTTPAQYNNYLHSRTRSGGHFTDDYAGSGHISIGYGSGPDVNYMYSGNPTVHGQWSECDAVNLPGDRTMIMASGDIALAPGATASITFIQAVSGLVYGNACGDSTGGPLPGILPTVDSGRAIYDGSVPPPLGVVNNVANTNNAAIHLYPNPAHNELIVADRAAVIAGSADIVVYNCMGQAVIEQHTDMARSYLVNIGQLSAGTYLISYTTAYGHETSRFIKE